MNSTVNLLNVESDEDEAQPVYNHDDEEDFSYNYFFLLLDPLFRFWFCGLSPFMCCKKSNNQYKIYKKVELKLLRELEIKHLMSRVHETHLFIDETFNK